MSKGQDQQPAAPPASSAFASLLQPGQNCWRVERADRLSVVVDGEAYFGAMRASCINARRFIAISAWDIHSRLELVRVADDQDHAPEPEPVPADGLPVVLSDLLIALLERRPRLEVFILLWKHAPIYAFEREPALLGDHPWPRHPRLHFVMDSAHPFAASQHQKIVVIDGRIAFCGGMDLSKWRWDTTAHAADEPRRSDPDGDPYPPYHDLHMLVDGDAASALMEQFTDRWRWAGGPAFDGLRLEPGDGRAAETDPWPDDLPVLLRDQRVGIARTLPDYDGREQVREIERLYLDTIDSARTLLYIENQLMIADDRVLRVASSNLSNRSMGLDSECDLCLVVETESDINAVRGLRQQLLGMLLSVPADAVARAEAEAAAHGCGLIAAVESLRAGYGDDAFATADGRPRLADLAGGADPEWNRQLPDERLIDPDQPLDPDLVAELVVGGEEHKPYLRWRLIVGVGVIGLLLTMAVVWRWTPAGEWLNPDTIAASVQGLNRTWWGPLVALVGFVMASLVAVPVTLLILATALVFDPITGAAVALTGSTLSALAGYGIGAQTGRGAVERLSGGGLERLSRRLAKHGILTMITVRIVPVAPFAVLNLFVGAAHLRLRDFLIGTVIGMAPAVIAMTLFAEGLLSLLRRADLRAVALLLVGLLALGGLAWFSRRWLRADA